MSHINIIRSWIPETIKFTNDEINNCRNLKNMIDMIYKTEVLIFKDTKETNTV